LPIQTTFSRFLPKDYTDNDATKKQVLFCNSFFGSDEWFDLIYEQQGGLFGNTIKKKDEADDILANWYAGRLKDLFGESSSPYMVKNTKNRGLYYLIWAGKNATGKKIASDVLTQGEKVKIKK
jgi:three-Cys-motif partner protein